MCYLCLELSDSDLYLLLLSLRYLGHSFFLLVKSVLPVTELAAKPALIVGLGAFIFSRFACYFNFQDSALKFCTLLIFDGFISVVSLFKVLT